MTDQTPASDSIIRVHTQFGEFEASASSIVVFAEGLPGFEQCRRFVVLQPARPSPLLCLYAIDGPHAAFLAIDPRRILRRYRCVLSEADRLRIGADPKTPLLWLSILTVGPGEELFANLRAPVVINPERLAALQVMPLDALYPLRQRLDLDELAATGTDGPACS